MNISDMKVANHECFFLHLEKQKASAVMPAAKPTENMTKSSLDLLFINTSLKAIYHALFYCNTTNAKGASQKLEKSEISVKKHYDFSSILLKTI